MRLWEIMEEEETEGIKRVSDRRRRSTPGQEEGRPEWEREEAGETEEGQKGWGEEGREEEVRRQVGEGEGGTEGWTEVEKVEKGAGRTWPGGAVAWAGMAWPEGGGAAKVETGERVGGGREGPRGFLLVDS